MNILEELAAHARMRAAEDKKRIPLEEMREQAQRLQCTEGNPFAAALKKPGLSFICEVKRASPSKGLIAPEFPYLDIARAYEAAGADCISCLTEPKWFLGSDDIFREIRDSVSTPMLRKDFTVDEYQIYQAKTMGADAVLLIEPAEGESPLCCYVGDSLTVCSHVAHQPEMLRIRSATSEALIGEIMEALEEAARSEGAVKLVSSNRQGNVASRELQKACGFEFESLSEEKEDPYTGEKYFLENNVKYL